jgi:hypothetical protein
MRNKSKFGNYTRGLLWRQEGVWAVKRGLTKLRVFPEGNFNDACLLKPLALPYD